MTNWIFSKSNRFVFSENRLFIHNYLGTGKKIIPITKLSFLILIFCLVVDSIYSNPGVVSLKSDPEWSEYAPEVSVFIDTYYAQSNRDFPDRERPFVTQALRDREFSVNHALLNLERDGSQFRYGLGIHTGTYVQANYVREQEQMQYIYQGYVGIKLAENLWLDMGIFPSHIGGESTLSIENFNYTRSLVAEGSPYYESGARLVWDVSDRMRLTFLVLNGWQEIRDSNKDKAGGVQWEYKISQDWSLNYSNFIGNEAPDSEQRQTRYFQDFYIKGKLTKNWAIYFIYDLGYQKRINPNWVEKLENPDLLLVNIEKKRYIQWQGYAIQMYFRLTEKLRLGLRAEGFSDPDRIIFNAEAKDGYRVDAGSLNLDYFAGENTALRVEYKRTQASDFIYRETNREAFRSEDLVVVSIASKISKVF